MEFETILQAIFDTLDPRLAPQLRKELEQLQRSPTAAPQASQRRRGTWVLAGHRTAGKTTLLPLISKLARVSGVDLDLELEHRFGRPLRAWLKEDVTSFRAAERALFLELAAREELVAVGGGFLALHGDLLADHTPVVIPITFETYRERLLADTTRPRLRPDLTPEEEIATVFQERESVHRNAVTLPLVQFLAALAKEGH